MLRLGLIVLLISISIQFALSQSVSDKIKSDSLLSVISSINQSNKNKIDAYIRLAELNYEKKYN